MAQTRRKRRRKHRGTQGGRVDDRPRRRPANRAEARQQAKARRGSGGGKKRQAASGPGGRPLRPPSWSRAIKTSAVIAGLLFVIFVLVLKEPIGPTLGLAAFMLCFYIPMSYYLDRYMYGRRLAQIAKERTESKQRD